MAKRFLLFFIFGFIFISTPAWTTKALAATAGAIDANVDEALQRFFSDVNGGKEFAKSAKGMLVMPGVIKGGFIIGGEYGEGALRIGGQTVDYYNVIAGSWGLQIGGQKKDILLIFMTDESLDQFRTSQGWEAGVDGNVAFIEIGAGERLDSNTVRDPIVAFVFGVKGLMADISLKGAKFTRLNKNQ